MAKILLIFVTIMASIAIANFDRRVIEFPYGQVDELASEGVTEIQVDLEELETSDHEIVAALNEDPLFKEYEALNFSSPVFRPPLEKELKKSLPLWATWYYLPTFASAPHKPIRLLTLDGKDLGFRLDVEEFCTASVQGSFQIKRRTGHIVTLNVAGRGPTSDVDCTGLWPYKGLGRTRFQLAGGPFGSGARANAVVQYRTIAVDPRVIPFGSVVYIPAARGNRVFLSTGEKVIHDGYFFAADRGGAVKGSQIDIFLGPNDTNPFSWIQSTSKGKFKAYIVDNEMIRGLMLEAHAQAHEVSVSSR